MNVGGRDDYRFDSTLELATFLNRPTRFTAEIEIDGNHSTAHINSSGRMQELLTRGRQVAVGRAGNRDRKSPFDLKLVQVGRHWMSIDSALPNRLVHHWLIDRRLPELGAFDSVRREVTVDHSRFDFVTDGPDGPCYIEVKSVTLSAGRWGIFPDAPTSRGTKHVHHLAELSLGGARCAVVFLMAHPRMEFCWANGVTDPEFEAAILRAKEAGVQLLAYRARVDRKGAALIGPTNVLPPDEVSLAALRRHVDQFKSVQLSYTAAERARPVRIDTTEKKTNAAGRLGARRR